ADFTKETQASSELQLNSYTHKKYRLVGTPRRMLWKWCKISISRWAILRHHIRTHPHFMLCTPDSIVQSPEKALRCTECRLRTKNAGENGSDYVWGQFTLSYSIQWTIDARQFYTYDAVPPGSEFLLILGYFVQYASNTDFPLFLAENSSRKMNDASFDRAERQFLKRRD
uniref:Uncharacterized protein n=1 Tax=Romanomermis culicivorax TaxID=13658 RepID=A0A915IZA6_ROMCU